MYHKYICCEKWIIKIDEFAINVPDNATVGSAPKGNNNGILVPEQYSNITRVLIINISYIEIGHY